MNAEKLNEQGQSYLYEGKFSEAIKCFRKALNKEEHPALRNNLALSYYLLQDLETAWWTLELNIRPEAAANPFAHSLAVQILHQLGRDQEAHQQLALAISDFENGIHKIASSGHMANVWGEYTVRILIAAGILNEHLQVYQLYRQWQNYHRHWHSTYFAGVAAFNLKRFRQAASLWSALQNEGQFYLELQQIAVLVDQGNIPPFTLDYEFVQADNIKASAIEAHNSGKAEDFRQLIAESSARLFYLSVILDENAPLYTRQMFLEILVQYGGDWGEQLGQNWLLSPVINQELKIPIITALNKAGHYKSEEAIEVYLDGKVRSVILDELAVSYDVAEEVEPLYQKAVTLAQQGKKAEALRILEKPMLEGKIFPPALSMLARLYHENGRMSEKERVVGILKSLYQQTGDSIILFDLALLFMQIGEPDRAERLLEQIDWDQIPADIRQQIFARFAETNAELMFQFNMIDTLEDMREKIEEKMIPIDASLKKGIKNMPVEWVDAACSRYELKPARLRAEREKQLIQYLQQSDHLKNIISTLDDDEIRLLQYLLSRGGWSRIGPVTRKFGSMYGDGFYWNVEEEGPYSPLGTLWSRGLVFVGRCLIDNRRAKIVTIPVELRPLLIQTVGQII